MRAAVAVLILFAVPRYRPGAGHPGLFLKASYNVWERDGIGSVSDSTISGARLEFGWGF